jgi:hypothetical protein
MRSNEWCDTLGDPVELFFISDSTRPSIAFMEASIRFLMPLDVVEVSHMAIGVPASGSESPSAPGGWYPDPSGRHDVRYWATDAWTREVLDGENWRVDRRSLPQEPPDVAMGKRVTSFHRDLRLVALAILGWIWPVGGVSAMAAGTIFLTPELNPILVTVGVGFATVVAWAAYQILVLLLPCTMTVFLNGFVYRRLGHRYQAHWDDVDLYHEATLPFGDRDMPDKSPPMRLKRLRLADGRTMKIPALLESAGKVILAESSARIGPRLKATLAGGKHLQFGRTSVGPDGFHMDSSRLLPWSDIRWIRVSFGRLGVGGGSRKVTWAPVRQIANAADVFFLIEDHLPQNASQRHTFGFSWQFLSAVTAAQLADQQSRSLRRYHPPPNWPAPPGWKPPRLWRPHSSLPPPPPGWSRSGRVQRKAG